MSPRPCCPAPFTRLRASLDAPILSQSRRAIQHDLLVCKPATRGHGNLAAEIVRSDARRRRHLAPPRLALPRADRRVDLPHQAVRLVLLLGLWRSLGGLRLSRAGSATGSAVPLATRRPISLLSVPWFDYAPSGGFLDRAAFEQTLNTTGAGLHGWLVLSRATPRAALRK